MKYEMDKRKYNTLFKYLPLFKIHLMKFFSDDAILGQNIWL